MEFDEFEKIIITDIIEQYPEYNHGKNRHKHRIFYIIGGSKRIGKHKGGRPYQHSASTVNRNQNLCQHHRLSRQIVNLQRPGQSHNNKTIPYNKRTPGQKHQLQLCLHPAAHALFDPLNSGQVFFPKALRQPGQDLGLDPG